MILSGNKMMEDLSVRYATAYNNGTRFFNQLYDAVRLAVPTQDGLNVLYEYNDGGRYLEFYAGNSTPQIAADKRASDMHSLLLPSGRRWGDVYTDDQYNDEDSEIMFKILQRSNIHSIAHTLFLDLTIGCAGLWIDSESKDNPLSFSALTGVAILPEFNGKLDPDSVWFKKAVGEQYLLKFGIDIKTYSYTNNVAFIISGFIKNRDHKGNPIYRVKNCDIYEWLYIEVLQDNWNNPLILEARKYKQLHIINDTVRAGEARGRGIVLKMLKDIQRLSQATESYNSQTQIQLNPPIMANESLGNFNFANLTGAVLPSALTLEGKPLLAPLQWKIELEEGRNYMERLENKINMAFNVEPYGAVGASPVRTATEIAAREAQTQRQSLTDISRIVYDFEGVFRTCLEMLKDKGIVGKGSHRITFKNPMLDAENQNQLNSLVTYKQLSDQIISPQFFAMTNNPNAVDQYLREKLNIPIKIADTEQQKQKAAQALKEAMQQQQPEQQAPSQKPQALQATPFGAAPQRQGFGV